MHFKPFHLRLHIHIHNRSTSHQPEMPLLIHHHQLQMLQLTLPLALILCLLQPAVNLCHPLSDQSISQSVTATHKSQITYPDLT
jgi:hypothetical protein